LDPRLRGDDNGGFFQSKKQFQQLEQFEHLEQGEALTKQRFIEIEITRDAVDIIIFLE
jgi:CMP-2-keto-3-deoxyoctulosonic acid synthetase